MAKLSAILDQVDAGTVLLPEFQRGYVWNRDQVRGLMRSLYKGYPVGALLVWETDAAGQAVRGAASVSGTRSLLLDGQQRVTTLYGVVHGESITGADKTVDVVVDIFNRVNSGGTKLSRGDLALARICSDWPQARPMMRAHLDWWRVRRGLRFQPDWLLRNVNAVATGRAPFSALENVTAEEFRDALGKAVHNVDHLVDLIASTLGLDHDRVLMGRNALPVLGRLLLKNNGRFADATEAGRALYWYVHAAVRGRFAGSTETFLAKDLETVDRHGIDGVIQNLRRTCNGSLTIDAQDFEGAGRGSRS